IGQSFEAEAVGGGAVENDEDLDVRAKMPLEFTNHRCGVRIVAIAHGVALVDGGDRPEDFGVNSGIVVAGKAARRVHVPNNLAEPAPRALTAFFWTARWLVGIYESSAF